MRDALPLCSFEMVTAMCKGVHAKATVGSEKHGEHITTVRVYKF
jgi:hypothetical protein